MRTGLHTQSEDPESARETREAGRGRELRGWENLASFLLPSSARHWAGRPGAAGGEKATACAHRKVSLPPGEVAQQGLPAPITPQVSPLNSHPPAAEIEVRDPALLCAVPGPPACSAPGSWSPPGGAGRRVGRWAAPPAGALGPSHELSALRPALANPLRSSRAALPLHAALPGSGSSAHDCLGWGVSRNPQPRAAGQRPSATRCLLGESAPLRRGMNCGAPVGFPCFPEYHAESIPEGTPNPAPSATAPGHCGGTPASRIARGPPVGWDRCHLPGPGQEHLGSGAFARKELVL